jgi:hypothetical protein
MSWHDIISWPDSMLWHDIISWYDIMSWHDVMAWYHIVSWRDMMSRHDIKSSYYMIIISCHFIRSPLAWFIDFPGCWGRTRDGTLNRQDPYSHSLPRQTATFVRANLNDKKSPRRFMEALSAIGKSEWCFALYRNRQRTQFQMIWYVCHTPNTILDPHNPGKSIISCLLIKLKLH